MCGTVSEQSTLNENVRIIRKALQSYRDHPSLINKKAAHYRVSTDQKVQQQSLDQQMESFQRIVASHPDWKLVDIFADEGLTGTQSENRPAF